jgi:hypothetical protein
MDGQKPEEADSQIQANDTAQSPKEGLIHTLDTSTVTAELQSVAAEAQNQVEEVRPQVVSAPQQPEERAGGMAISAMVTGIAGILCSWVIFFSFPLGLASLILGIIEFKRIKAGEASEKGRGMAITGIVLGSLTLFSVVTSILILAFTAIGIVTGISAFLPSLLKQFGIF